MQFLGFGLRTEDSVHQHQSECIAYSDQVVAGCFRNHEPMVMEMTDEALWKYWINHEAIATNFTLI